MAEQGCPPAAATPDVSRNSQPGALSPASRRASMMRTPVYGLVSAPVCCPAHHYLLEETLLCRSDDGASCCIAAGRTAESLSCSPVTGATMPPGGGLRGAWRAGDDQPTPAISSSAWRSRLPLCFLNSPCLPSCSSALQVPQMLIRLRQSGRSAASREKKPE